MARLEWIFEVFIASPSDVARERRIVAEIIERINAKYDDYSLKPVMWERDYLRAFNEPDTQAKINTMLGRCDLMIAVFGGIMGTPTARTAGGAIEEIQEFDGDVYLYLKESNERRLFDELEPHFDRMRNRVYETYDGEQDLKDKVDLAISRWFNRQIVKVGVLNDAGLQAVRQDHTSSPAQRTDDMNQEKPVDSDSSATGIEAVPEQIVQQPVSRQPARQSIRGSVADLLREGLLAAGALIISEPRPGERYTATVLASGDIQLPDGRTFSSLSGAGKAVAGRSFGGWDGWWTEDGRTLYELRSELQFASDYQTHATGAVQQAESVDPVSAGTEIEAVLEQVVQPASSQGARKKMIRGSVADLLREGLLAVGAQIICEPRPGERYTTATVLASGDIQLPDGRTFNSLSGAGGAVSGREVNGWRDWRTEDGQTLHELRSRLQFASGIQRRAIRGSVADLLSQGLLAAGAQIICEPRPGEQYTATVLGSGDIQLTDGRTFRSLSGAGKAVAGRVASGWHAWRTEDGRTLYELRSELQFASDHQTHATGAVPQAESVDPVSSEIASEGMPTAPVSQQPASSQGARKKMIRGSVADLLREGLLAVGAQIICEPRLGERRTTATVLASGDIQLPDGRTFNNLSAAGEAVMERRSRGWRDWRTENGRTLNELRSELQVASGIQRRVIRGSVADLLREGLLAVGAQIICEPRPGEHYTATVLASGDIQLPDGRTFSNLSAAETVVAGRKPRGWTGWRTEDGQTLHELRSRLPE